jgi:hypothetical protein
MYVKYLWHSKGSTYSAVVPLTNSFGLYQIPEPEPEPGQLLIIPINLVLFQMMSEVVRYEIKNFITWTLDFENWHKKSGLVRTQRTKQLILVDPVDDEEVEDSSTDWSSKRLTMCDLKKRKNVIHSSWSNRSSLYIGYGKY